MKSEKVGKYYSLVMNEETKEADINIFGDICGDGGWFSKESDVGIYKLSKQLEELGNVKKINVHISSYGGEVKEGLAIYNALKNHKAKVKTYCDGFACSIASVIFMAGDERIMSKASALMIHNAWMYTSGNANELRKQAEDLDKITKCSIEAYMEHLNISEEELKTLLDEETWLNYEECLDMGFATSVTSSSNSEKASQSVRDKLVKMIFAHQAETDTETDDEDENKDNNIEPNVETDDTNNNDDEDKSDSPKTNEGDDDETENPKTDEETNNPETDSETSDDSQNGDDEDENDDENKETNENVVALFNVICKSMIKREE